MAIMEEQEELRQSFQTEAYTYVSRARQLLADLVVPVEPAAQELDVLAGETRTLKQQASLAGLLDISNLAYQLEGEIRRLGETEALVSDEHHETLKSYVDSIEQFLHFYFRNTGNAFSIDQLLKPEEGFQLTRQIQELYWVESEEHIQDINALLLRLESGKAEPVQAVEEVYRNVHSIKGDSNALGFNEVAAKAHDLENFLSELQTAQSTQPVLEPEQLERLFSEMAQLEELIKLAAAEPAEQSEPAEETPETVQSESQLAVTPEPLPEVDISELEDNLDYLFEDQAMLELYYQEALELVTTVAEGLIQLKDNPADIQLVHEMYRAAHTLKGNSYALGVERVGDATKPIEDLLQPLRTAQRADTETLNKVSERLTLIQGLLHKIGVRMAGQVDSGQPAQAQAVQGQGSPAFTQVQAATHVALPAMSTSFFENEAADIPEEIRQIYLQESRELVEHVGQLLLEVELGQTPLKQALDEIYRAMQTLKGNSYALELNSIGDVTHHFENLLERLRKNPEHFDAVGTQGLFKELEPLQKLIGTLSGSTDAADYDLDLSEIPEEVRVIFLEESRELLELVSHQLLDLEQGQTSLEHALEETYRAIHTLKGNANALGITWIGESAHEMESLLSELREKPDTYGPSTTESLFRHLDGLRRQSEALEGLKPEPAAGPVDPIRTTLEHPKRITESRTPQQIVDAVHRDKAMFEEFEQRLSSGSKKLDLRSTHEIKPDKAQPAIAPAGSSGAAEETIRVGINKVDKLINLADELLISRISFEQQLRELREMVSLLETAQHQLRLQAENAHDSGSEQLSILRTTLNRLENQAGNVSKDLRKNNAAFGLLVDEIQYHARSTRMLPAAYLLNPLRLVVRNTSAKLAKKVQLQITGEDIEMDRLLIERLKDPLAHLLRNAIDHGVETSEQRLQSGKSVESKITIAISVAGNMIRFQIHDDGRGIDYNKIRQKAIRIGMATAEQAELLSEHDLHSLLFSPGFTTTEQVTDISGRGVGLDVVKSTLDALNGSIEVSSALGRGTLFTLMVPVTLTTFDAFLVSLSDQTFALARSAVMATLSVKQSEVTDSSVSRAIYYDDQPVRLVSLQQLLQLPEPVTDPDEFAVLVVDAGQQRLALMVDTVLESQQMVMKSLGTQLQKVPYVSGATVLGNGEPVIVLNLPEIVSQLTNQGNDRMSVMVATSEAESRPRRGKTRVLVVDDSVTTRTLEKNILEAAGFEVVIAKNGKEGQEAVLREMPNLDLVITDVEMPKMTGYEFASWLKHESEYRETPVIMVTSLATPEFKAKGWASGINAYIVKGEFNQQTLLDTISQLLASA